MSSEDLAQQLAEDVALQIHWKRRGHDDPANEQPCAGPDDSDREWARAAVAAVLASGLVVLTSAVNDLAVEHGVSETPGRCVCGFWLVTDMSEHILAMLRALIRQETP
jgi:hypothetical protein